MEAAEDGGTRCKTATLFVMKHLFSSFSFMFVCIRKQIVNVNIGIQTRLPVTNCPFEQWIGAAATESDGAAFSYARSWCLGAAEMTLLLQSWRLRVGCAVMLFRTPDVSRR